MKENKNAQKTSEREEFPQTETGHLWKVCKGITLGERSIPLRLQTKQDVHFHHF
jgi:hypothetical protein